MSDVPTHSVRYALHSASKNTADGLECQVTLFQGSLKLHIQTSCFVKNVSSLLNKPSQRLYF